MLNPATSLTLGGLTVALALLVWRGVRWWRNDHRNVKALTPFLLGLALGLLSVLCTGGLLGLISGSIANAMNMGGDRVLYDATGTPAPTINGGARPGVITPAGAMILVLLVVGLATAWRSLTKPDSRDLSLGAISGSGLGLSAGGAGLAAAIFVPLINGIGQELVGTFN